MFDNSLILSLISTVILFASIYIILHVVDAIKDRKKEIEKEKFLRNLQKEYSFYFKVPTSLLK